MLQKSILATLLCLPISVSADYCSGEWSDSAEAFCSHLMTYPATIAIDRMVGRPKEEVEEELTDASMVFSIPSHLASNYIDFVYMYGPTEIDIKQIQAALFGGCIDNYDIIKTEYEEETEAREQQDAVDFLNGLTDN